MAQHFFGRGPGSAKTELPWIPPTYIVVRPDDRLPSIDEAVAVIHLFVNNGDLFPPTPRSQITAMLYSFPWRETNEPGFLAAVAETTLDTFDQFVGLLTTSEEHFAKHPDLKMEIVGGVSNAGKYRVVLFRSRHRFPTALPLKRNVNCAACGMPYSLTFPQQLEQWRRQNPAIDEFDIRCNNPPCEEVTLWIEPSWIEPVA